MKSYNMGSYKEGARMENKILEAGIYLARIVSAEEGITAKENEKVDVKYEVVDDATVFESIVFADKIMGRTKHFLHVIDEPYQGTEVEPQPENWIGKELRLRLNTEKYINRFGIQKSKNVVEEHLFVTEEEQKKYEDEKSKQKTDDEEVPF